MTRGLFKEVTVHTPPKKVRVHTQANTTQLIELIVMEVDKKKGKHRTLSSLEDHHQFNGSNANSSESLVYISRRPILEAVGLATGLKIQGYTHWYNHSGMVQASVLIGLPRQKGSHRESSMPYEGEPAETEDEAKEKAAQMALECMHLHRLQHFHQRPQLLRT